jgi:hypothetical protein
VCQHTEPRRLYEEELRLMSCTFVNYILVKLNALLLVKLLTVIGSDGH